MPKTQTERVDFTMYYKRSTCWISWYKIDVLLALQSNWIFNQLIQIIRCWLETKVFRNFLKRLTSPEIEKAISIFSNTWYRKCYMSVSILDSVTCHFLEYLLVIKMQHKFYRWFSKLFSSEMVLNTFFDDSTENYVSK